MSTAMRSTLQTVPESLEVTKTSTPTQDAPVTASTKTPAKASGEVVATKSSRYNFQTPSSINKPITIKNQMMRLLRRSKSTAAAHTEKTAAKTPPGHHQPHHHYHHNHVVHPQHNRNGGMVVNMVEGVPLVVGGGIGGKSKKFLLDAHLKNPFWKLIHPILGYKKVNVTTVTYDLDIKAHRDLKKMREEECFEEEERIRVFVNDIRGL